MAIRAAGAVGCKTFAPAPLVTTRRPGVAALAVWEQATGSVLLGQDEDYFALVDVMALKPLTLVAA